jgi:hypothetical protein
MTPQSVCAFIVCMVIFSGLAPVARGQTGPHCGKKIAYTGQSSIDTSNRTQTCYPPNLNPTAVVFGLTKDVYFNSSAQRVEAGPYDATCSTDAPLYITALGDCRYVDGDGNPIFANPICDPDITDQGHANGFNPSYTNTYPTWAVLAITMAQYQPPDTAPGYMRCKEVSRRTFEGKITGNCPPGGLCSPPPCTRCGPVCLENVSCPCPQDRATCDQTSGGLLPVCHGQCTPIVLDPFDEGFHLTGVGAGVKFRVKANGPMVQMSWTDQSRRNGWLVLDRNGNGTIDDFTELFGNVTPQPQSQNPNGFLALAVFDDPANGGNGNAAIDPGDAVYPQLRVWIDANHNGVSEASELYTLQDLGIFKIGLRYHVTSFTDQFGNVFRYRSRVWSDDSHGRDICYDVFLQMAAIVGGAQ